MKIIKPNAMLWLISCALILAVSCEESEPIEIPTGTTVLGGSTNDDDDSSDENNDGETNEENFDYLTQVAIQDEDVEIAVYRNSYVQLEGSSTLKLTSGATSMLSNSIVAINSGDARVYLPSVKMDDWTKYSLANSFRINGNEPLVDGVNCQILGYYDNLYIKSIVEDYAPAIIYSGTQSANVTESTIYTGSAMPLGDNNVDKILLKKGYQVVVADSEDGVTASKCYLAINKDREITLESDLSGKVSFMRVLPFSYINKRGICAKSYVSKAHSQMDLGWYYTWGVSDTSTADLDFVPMFWSASFASTANIDLVISKPYTHQALAFNEPDNKDQANMEVADAITLYKTLLRAGVRMGSPATEQVGTTTGWTNTAKWNVQFLNQAIEEGIRVDFIAIHWYDVGYASNLSTATAAASVSRLKAHLDACYSAYGKPIWITEFNVGSYTNGWDVHHPFIELVVPMLEEHAAVERYAYFPVNATIDGFISGDTTSIYGDSYLETATTPAIVPDWE